MERGTGRKSQNPLSPLRVRGADPYALRSAKPMTSRPV